MAQLELVWTRAPGLVALALPVVLLLVSRLRTRPPTRPTGTYALWRRIAGAAPAEARANRPRIPLAVWLLAAGLAAGAVALGGPRLERPEGPRQWTVVVDHSPSTALAWRAEDGPGSSAGDSRLERALAAAADWVDEHVRAGDRVRWLSAAREPHDALGPEPPPRRWQLPAERPVERPDWTLNDRAGTLFVTDRAPDPRPAEAGWFASGGAAVHGPVAVDGRDRLDWDGEKLVRVPGAIVPGCVALPAEGVPAPLRGIVAAWAASRGLDVAAAEPDDCALAIVAARGTPDATPVTCARDGWSARATTTAGGLEVPAAVRSVERWLTDGERALVLASPGEIRLGLLTMEEPAGDPAAFAVSWSRLLDRYALSPPGVVVLDDRRPAGEASSREPAPPPAASDVGAQRAEVPVDAWLAAVSALFALAAIGAGLLGRAV